MIKTRKSSVENFWENLAKVGPNFQFFVLSKLLKKKSLSKKSHLCFVRAGLLQSRLRDMMLSRPPGDLSHFLMRDFNLQKKALDFLNFRHHLDMEEEWNENSAAQVSEGSWVRLSTWAGSILEQILF